MIMSLNTNPKIVVSLLFFLCPFQLSDHILISVKSNGSCLDGKSPHWQHFIISCGQKGNLTGYFFLWPCSIDVNFRTFAKPTSPSPTQQDEMKSGSSVLPT